MKIIIFYIILFSMYVGPEFYGLVTKEKMWIVAGIFWLLFGWIPLLVFGSLINDELSK